MQLLRIVIIGVFAIMAGSVSAALPTTLSPNTSTNAAYPNRGTPITLANNTAYPDPNATPSTNPDYPDPCRVTYCSSSSTNDDSRNPASHK
jgi:hypothetical protein